MSVWPEGIRELSAEGRMKSPSDGAAALENLGESLDSSNAKQIRMPRNCSFSPTDWRVLSQQWFPIVAESTVGTAPVAVRLLDVDLVVYRLGTAIRVAEDRCPHRGAPLSMGRIEGSDLICAYHGLHYGPHGQCRKIPAQPDLKPPARFRLTMLRSFERYGLVWTCLDPLHGEPRIPSFPEWARPGVLSILLPHVDIAASAGRQIEGFLDVAHFAWVHRDTFADQDDAVVPHYDTRVTEYGLQSECWSDVSNYPKTHRGQEPPGFRWLRLFDVYPPFSAMLTIHFPDNGRLWILNLASPVSARRTRLFVPWARNFDIEGSIEDIHAFNAKIIAEDQAIIERQQPQELPLDLNAEIHFAADRTSLAYRRLLKQMGLSFRPVAGAE
jgi:phenylpropionate dioxygenase-like ring-hydroxylating dioxygenase large terminal subunit